MLPRLMLLTTVVVGFAALAAAQYAPLIQQRSITVTATADAMVAPDLALAAVAVETQAPTVAAATAQNNTASNAVIAAIRALNIPALTIRTLSFDVQPVYETPKPNQTQPLRIVAYRVVNRIQARIPDTDTDRLSANTGRVFDAALGAGANRVDSLAFDLQDSRRALRAVLEQAARDAHDIANTLATASDVKLGSLQTITTQPIYRPVIAMARNAEMAAAPSVPIVAGQIPISATVTAVYAIQ